MSGSSAAHGPAGLGPLESVQAQTFQQMGGHGHGFPLFTCFPSSIIADNNKNFRCFLYRVTQNGNLPAKFYIKRQRTIQRENPKWPSLLKSNLRKQGKAQMWYSAMWFMLLLYLSFLDNPYQCISLCRALCNGNPHTCAPLFYSWLKKKKKNHLWSKCFSRLSGGRISPVQGLSITSTNVTVRGIQQTRPQCSNICVKCYVCESPLYPEGDSCMCRYLPNGKWKIFHAPQGTGLSLYLSLLHLFCFFVCFPTDSHDVIPSLESDNFNCINKKIGWFGLIVFTRDRNWEFSV